MQNRLCKTSHIRFMYLYLFSLLTLITKLFEFSNSVVQSSEKNSLKTVYKIY